MTTPDLPPVLTPAPGTAGPVLYLNPYNRTYTTSRSYGLRMQRGFAQGVPQVVARRGAGARQGEEELSEFQRRRLRFLERYGFDETLWRRWYRLYIREINSMASPGAQIDKTMVRQVLANSEITGLGADWMEQRLKEKLADMIEYRAIKHGGPGTGGFLHYWADVAARGFTPIEFWYYH